MNCTLVSNLTFISLINLCTPSTDTRQLYYFTFVIFKEDFNYY